MVTPTLGIQLNKKPKLPPFALPTAEVENETADPVAREVKAENPAGLVGQKLTLEAFKQLSGHLSGISFVKVVVDREKEQIHFINNSKYEFHAHYIAEQILGISAEKIDRDIDKYNKTFYTAADRRFYLGIIGLHQRRSEGKRSFFTLETVEVDTMNRDMVRFFFNFVKDQLDSTLPLLWKPANHLQETIVMTIDPAEMPRVYSHELFTSASFIALHAGSVKGRLRAFRTPEEYQEKQSTLEWYDIIAMDRVPDTIPRLSGIINAQMTTPLSHTNVLAAGWRIPNSIQIGVFDLIDKDSLIDQWVEYRVSSKADAIFLKKTERPENFDTKPAWTLQQVKIEEPEVLNTPILGLSELRQSDRYKYGTKAANLGELNFLKRNGSERMLGYYRVIRPPRENLLPYLAKFLGVPETANLLEESTKFVQKKVHVPRGIAIPFSYQQEFCESSPRIQQMIGKLKMALELGAREADVLSLSLQSLIRSTRMPPKIRNEIDAKIASNLSGVSNFVIRSSSNAEDLENFSAAGIYESINHVTTADRIFDSIKEVWASMLSPRSVRLRQQVGIPLDNCYMGVIVQEQVPAEMGGVMVTTNPMDQAHGDFRNVYINVSKTPENVVAGSGLPMQYHFNTVEGNGRTLSIGDAKEDLPEAKRKQLGELAFIGRLLQSHFSPDYMFDAPVDIEWIINDQGISILQLRPYVR